MLFNSRAQPSDRAGGSRVSCEDTNISHTGQETTCDPSDSLNNHDIDRTTDIITNLNTHDMKIDETAPKSSSNDIRSFENQFNNTTCDNSNMIKQMYYEENHQDKQDFYFNNRIQPMHAANDKLLDMNLNSTHDNHNHNHNNHGQYVSPIKTELPMNNFHRNQQANYNNHMKNLFMPSSIKDNTASSNNNNNNKNQNNGLYESHIVNNGRSTPNSHSYSKSLPLAVPSSISPLKKNSTLKDSLNLNMNMNNTYSTNNMNKCIKPSNCSLISSMQLGRLLSTVDKSNLLILDLRPFTERSKKYIIDSIHICLPSTLLRRKNFTIDKLVENLPFDIKQKMINKLNDDNIQIILYDNITNQTDNSISISISGMALKLLTFFEKKNSSMNSDNNGSPSSNNIDMKNKILILESGFSHFQQIFPEFILQYENNFFNGKNYTNQNSFSNNPNNHNNNSNNILNQINNNYNSELNLLYPNKVNNASFNFDNKLTPPLPISNQNSSNENSISDSPISSSSPISALFTFQLPTTNNLPQQLFKFTQNEELMNLESYLSAVNISEQNQRNQKKIFDPVTPNKKDFNESQKSEFDLLSNDIPSLENNCTDSNLHRFEFPKRSLTNFETDPISSTTPNLNKLNVQIKFDHLTNKYSVEEINKVIPIWFQKLMSRPKIEFIAQYQKLDILERKRLNSSISKNFPPNTNIIHQQTGSDLIKSINQNNLLNNKKCSPKRSNSQPIIQLKANKDSWLTNLNDDLTDPDDDQIVISSGLELGSKNRYKDIFPYEHTRVHLKKNSLSSNNSGSGYASGCSSTHFSGSANISNITDDTTEDEFDEDDFDISNNYINANYLYIPELDLTGTPPSSIFSNNNFVKVRYIATQAPMLSTVHDFYTCILNDNIPIVLTLTDNFENGVEKCFKYWQEKDFNGIRVELLDEMDYTDNICIRRIQLHYENNQKQYELLQIQLKDWPDLGVSKKAIDIIQLVTLKNFIMQKLIDNENNSIRNTNTNSNNNLNIPTILVHCSAGCGRTGTWCTIDSILSNLNTFNFLQNFYSLPNSTYDPISWIINIFRKQRISMVQNITQFLSIYDSLLYYFILRLNEIRCNKNSNYNKDVITWYSLYDNVKNVTIINDFINSKITN